MKTLLDRPWCPREPAVPGRTRRLAVAAVVLTGWIAAAAAPGAVRAQDPDGQNAAEATGSGALETAIEVQKLELQSLPDGRELRRWVAAGRLDVGDEIHYTVRVRNPGKQPVTDVVVTKRLPFGVRYLRGTAAGPAAEVQFSVDGGKTFATPEALSRAAGGGKKGARKSLENDYTHVRWLLGKPLGPASTALLRFRATFS
jgi:uncharacterized repeat protein (TIGR01451 family)